MLWPVSGKYRPPSCKARTVPLAARSRAAQRITVRILRAGFTMEIIHNCRAGNNMPDYRFFSSKRAIRPQHRPGCRQRTNTGWSRPCRASSSKHPPLPLSRLGYTLAPSGRCKAPATAMAGGKSDRYSIGTRYRHRLSRKSF
jgi:hypothetical protein